MVGSWQPSVLDRVAKAEHGHSYIEFEAGIKHLSSLGSFLLFSCLQI